VRIDMGNSFLFLREDIYEFEILGNYSWLVPPFFYCVGWLRIRTQAGSIEPNEWRKEQ